MIPWLWTPAVVHLFWKLVLRVGPYWLFYPDSVRHVQSCHKSWGQTICTLNSLFGWHENQEGCACYCFDASHFLSHAKLAARLKMMRKRYFVDDAILWFFFNSVKQIVCVRSRACSRATSCVFLNSTIKKNNSLRLHISNANSDNYIKWVSEPIALFFNMRR